MIDFNLYKPKKNEVYAYKCPECGTLDYPVPMICRKCGARRDPSGVYFSSWEKIPMEGNCKLLTWSRVFALPEGFLEKYLLFCIVEFENGLRASGRLLVDKPQIGMNLVTKIGIVREKAGENVLGFMFDKEG